MIVITAWCYTKILTNTRVYLKNILENTLRNENCENLDRCVGVYFKIKHSNIIRFLHVLINLIILLIEECMKIFERVTIPAHYDK